MGEQRKVTPIVRQRAQSGRVSYAEPTVLHETSRRRVVFIPFFVTHSDRTELAVKIVTSRKMDGAEWMIFDEKSIPSKNRRLGDFSKLCASIWRSRSSPATGTTSYFGCPMVRGSAGATIPRQ